VYLGHWVIGCWDLGADGIAFWRIWATNYFLERSKLLNFKVITLVLDCSTHISLQSDWGISYVLINVGSGNGF
jgi:hypothetical protein